ncbi:MAG: class I tRNA ligase family protein, partial [Candidatus Magasanikbacteria bacterium]|nr:class I tRNA ligase family protein [Candidatus Magasanikbacteria bacterium]
NISRFTLLNIENPKVDFVLPKNSTKTLADSWILDRLERTRRSVTESFEKNNFSYAGDVLRDFTWNELADWYLEVAKVEGGKSDILNYVLNTILKLWHPFMPFVTETIWENVYGKNTMLIVEKWPTPYSFGHDYFFENNSPTDAEKDFAELQSAITQIRTLRAENGIEPVKKIKAYVTSTAKYGPLLYQNNLEVFKNLARLEEVDFVNPKPAQSVGFVQGDNSVYLDFAGAVDKDKEKTRLEKEIATVAPYVESMTKKLSNTEFVNNAPPQVIDGERKKLADAEAKLSALKAQLAAL